MSPTWAMKRMQFLHVACALAAEPTQLRSEKKLQKKKSGERKNKKKNTSWSYKLRTKKKDFKRRFGKRLAFFSTWFYSNISIPLWTWKSKEWAWREREWEENVQGLENNIWSDGNTGLSVPSYIFWKCCTFLSQSLSLNAHSLLFACAHVYRTVVIKAWFEMASLLPETSIEHFVDDYFLFRPAELFWAWTLRGQLCISFLESDLLHNETADRCRSVWLRQSKMQIYIILAADRTFHTNSVCFIFCQSFCIPEHFNQLNGQ